MIDGQIYSTMYINTNLILAEEFQHNLAIYVDEDGSVVEEFGEQKIHKVGHIRNAPHYHMKFGG